MYLSGLRMMNNKYWMLVASKDHVIRGVEGGFAQACHGKSSPLKRTKIDDGIIYYSPKLEFGMNMICQEFTAIGFVSGEDVYQQDMGNGFIPYRRNISYVTSCSVPIKGLIQQLDFIADKRSWGYKFRFGAFEISKADFYTIAHEMKANLKK